MTVHRQDRAADGPPEQDELARLRLELDALRARYREAEETLAAIRSGDVDAIIVHDESGNRIYTLENDDRPYRRLIEQIGECALTLTADGLILYCNRHMAKLLQMPLERSIGSRIQDVVSAKDRDMLELLLAGGGGRMGLTVCSPSSGGATVPVQLSLTTFADTNPRTLCGIMTDLTEQKQVESALRETHARLLAESVGRERAEGALRQAQKMEALGQLTGGIAHDFNNLLTSIVGGLEMVERQFPELPEDGRAARGMKLARMGVDRAAQLTHRLLAFTRQQTLNPCPLDANGLIQTMLEMLRRTLGETVSLQADLARDLWPALADANQLESALLNLAVNARDAMGGGGRLLISTANRSVTAGDGSGVGPGDYVVISVADSGVGMDEMTRERAFEPFFTTKEPGQGTGLGLSQVYGFARQSGGHVALTSVPGEGTTVDIYLPRPAVSAASAAPPREASTETPGATARETVLVVEDTEAVRLYSVEALRELGYDVLEAADGAAALDILRRRPEVRLLFTDIGLPGRLNGRQLAREALRCRGGLKVLLTTGYDPPAKKGRDLPDSGIITLMKPFNFRDLAASVRRTLDGR